MRHLNAPKLFLIIFIVIVNCAFTEGIWSWLFSGPGKAASKTGRPTGSTLGALVSVPFEMRTADEKFLVEAQKYGLQLSDLDLCHHKVIMQLKKSCSALTEEDIGKLSVTLLNCQSAVEGRPTFTCTDGMSLRECTQDMDQNTWNSYHIVSNRARAVCYAARQQQFTAKTEMTVNKLVSTAEHQLDSLKKLEHGQSKVHDMTNKTLSTMASGQQDLMVRQERLKTSQHEIHSFISNNLRQLTREKTLIAAGQKELADMTEAIKNKLDQASQNLQNNELERQNNHKEILQDLQTVQTKARDVWEKIENSTERILKQHSETANHYRETLDNLKRINSSINYLLSLLDQTRSEVDMKLGWLTSLIGGAGDQLQVIYCLTLHGVYLTTGAIIAAFLQVHALTRVALLVLVSTNALLEVKHFACLDFVQITTILLATVVGHGLINVTLRRLTASAKLPSHGCEPKFSLLNSVNRTSTPVKSKMSSSKEMESGHKLHSNSSRQKYDVELNKKDYELWSSDIVEQEKDSDKTVSDMPSAIASTSREDIPSKTHDQDKVLGVKKDLLSLGLLDISSRTANSSRSSTPTRRSGSSTRKYCQGLSRNGAPCRAVCTDGKTYCHRHLDQAESDM